jgi:hypothetical protein
VLSLRPPSRPSLPCSRELRTRHACPPPSAALRRRASADPSVRFWSSRAGPQRFDSRGHGARARGGGGRVAVGHGVAAKCFPYVGCGENREEGRSGGGLGWGGGRGEARWRSLLGWGERSTLRGNAAQCVQALADLERLCSALPRHGGAWVGHGECVVCMAAPRCAPLRPCCHARCADRARRTWCGAVSRRAARRWSGTKRGPSD